MDFQFISGLAVWCLEAHAKATVLTMVDMDTGYVGVLVVSGKSPDNFMVGSTASFVNKLMAEKTRLRYDNEPAMRQLAETIAAFRHPRSTIPKPTNPTEHRSVNGVERAHQSFQAATRALRTDIRARTGEDIARGGTLGDIRTGTYFKSPLLPFMEAYTIRVPIDPPGLRKKLDVQWMKRIWVGGLDESNGHVVLTPHETVTGRTLRRQAGNLRVHPDLVGKLKSRVQDSALSQAELLNVLPASVPSGEQAEPISLSWPGREQMSGLVDDRARAEVTRPFRSLEDDNDKDVRRQRFGEPLATIPEEFVGRDKRHIDGPHCSTRSRRDSSVNSLQKPSTRSEGRIVEKREVHIKHLRHWRCERLEQ